MTTETKLGLLLGMGVIILVGIFISDHLSKANSQEPAGLAGGLEPDYQLDESDLPPSLEQARQGGGGEGLIVEGSRRSEPLPLPDDYQPEPRATRQTQPLEQGRQQAEAEPQRPEPRITYQDLPVAMIEQSPRGQVIDGEQPLSQGSDASERQELPEELEYVEQREERRFDPDALEREREQARQEQARRQREQQRERERLLAQRQAERRESSTNTSTRSSSEDRVTHTVQEDETLSSIAKQYYGSAGYYKMIYEANRERIPNPNFVRPGVRLVIPDANGSVAQRQNSDTAAATGNAGSQATQTYTVKENDTLSSIAQRFFGSRTQWQKVYEMNKDRLESPDRLSVGTELRVPVR